MNAAIAGSIWIAIYTNFQVAIRDDTARQSSHDFGRLARWTAVAETLRWGQTFFLVEGVEVPKILEK